MENRAGKLLNERKTLKKILSAKPKNAIETIDACSDIFTPTP
jgi:hypothetical protein